MEIEFVIEGTKSGIIQSNGFVPRVGELVVWPKKNAVKEFIKLTVSDITWEPITNKVIVDLMPSFQK